MCTLDRLKVRSDNFVDEDGEWLSMKDVIGGILQPLALKMVQRHGIIYVYDLNGLWYNGASETVEWQSDDQMMSAAEVANNAKITLSVYADKTLISDELELFNSIDKSAINIQNTSTGVNSYYPDYAKEWLDSVDGYKNISFSIHYGDKVKLKGAAEFGGLPFHIQPFFGGEETNGVAYMFMTGGHGSLKTGWPKRIGSDPKGTWPKVLIRSNRGYLPKLSNSEEYTLRVIQDLLIDTRYNPFSSANKNNDEDNYNSVKKQTGYLFVPVMIQVYDESGHVLCHYNNADKCKRDNAMGFVQNKGHWVNGPDPLNSYLGGAQPYYTADAVSCFLEWYDGDDRKESAGIQGWKKNRHSIGLSDKDVTGLIESLADGEYVPYPPTAGYLEVAIVSGIYPYDYGEKWYYNGVPAGMRWQDKKHYDKLRWMLYKAPLIELCHNRPPYNEAEFDDIEYSGLIDENAKEDIEIDTIVGTSETAIPSSRAILMSTTTGDQVHQLTRGSRTATAEQLLIGTLYSQYASRKTKLAGTTSIIKRPLPYLRERMQGDTKFLLLSYVENCKEDQSEMSMIEFRPDEYTDK